MSRKSLPARAPLQVITLDKDMGLYLQETCPCVPTTDGFFRRVLCCECFKRVAWAEAARLVKYVKTDVPCKACRSTKKEEV